MFGNFVNEPWAPPPASAKPLERWTHCLHDGSATRAGHMPYVASPRSCCYRAMWCGGGAAVRLLLFAWSSGFVAWIQMALTQDAGTGASCSADLALPYMFIAVAFAAASLQWAKRWADGCFFSHSRLMITNLLTVNQYVYQLARFGAEVAGVTPFTLSVRLRLCISSDHRGDWGILNRYHLNRGGCRFRPIRYIRVREPFESRKRLRLRRSPRKKRVVGTRMPRNFPPA